MSRSSVTSGIREVRLGRRGDGAGVPALVRAAQVVPAAQTRAAAQAQELPTGKLAVGPGEEIAVT